MQQQASIKVIQSEPFYVPFYNKTANGHLGAARGWNTFGFQANPLIAQALGFTFDDFHFAQQCDHIITDPSYDSYCSIDSGWSLNGGDRFGRLEPDTSVFSTFGIRGLSDHLHSRGVKLGIYVVPGALVVDQDVIIENTTIRLGDVLDNSTDFFGRRAFLWGKDGVQQWHDSVVRNFVSL